MRLWAALLTAATLGTCWLRSSVTRAHQGRSAAHGERFVVLEAREDGLRLVLTLVLGPELAQGLVLDADVDGDRRLSAQERRALGERWQGWMQEQLPVWLDGRRCRLRWEQPFVDAAGLGAAATLELAATCSVTPGRHRMRFEDRMNAEPFARSELIVRAHPPVVLEGVETGEDRRQGTPPVRIVARHGEPLPPVALLARWPSSARAAEGLGPRWQAWLLAAAGALVASAAAAAFAWRRRRRRSGTSTVTGGRGRR